jgi:hypothetical protein
MTIPTPWPLAARGAHVYFGTTNLMGRQRDTDDEAVKQARRLDADTMMLRQRVLSAGRRPAWWSFIQRMGKWPLLGRAAG